MRDGLGRYGRVLLLGGTSEIGAAVLHRLPLAPGAVVTLAGRDLAALQRVDAPPDVRVQHRHFDALDPTGHAELVAAVLAGGDLDLVVAAAGVLRPSVGDPAAAAREVLGANLVGLVSVLAPLAEAMRAQRHGTLVVLSSVAALRARRANYLYGASKAGLDAYASGLADDLAGAGVRVLVVRPGFVRGRMTAGLPVPPLASTPQGVGDAVAHALRGRSQIAYAPAPWRVVGPALRLVPRALWRRLEL